MSDVPAIPHTTQPGDPRAAGELLPVVYQELRRLAAEYLHRETPGQTLQPTALVHEAYLRLVGAQNARVFNDRGHFFAVAATVMRRILIDNARRKRADKHGGGMSREPLDAVAAPAPDEQLIALDQALQKLAAVEPEQARLVELRYFAGLSGDEAAGVMGISPSTADRYWTYARAWLQTEIGGQTPH